MNFYKYLLISASLLISTAAYAETVKGCRINDQDFLYDNYIGEQEYAVSQWYKPKFQTYTQASRAPFNTIWYNGNNCPRFGSVSIGSPQCAVQGITTVSGNGVQNLGNTVTYELVYPNCNPAPVEVPLDDYAWAILVSVGGWGTYKLNRHNNLSC